MLGNIGLPSFILIFVAALFVFGPEKLPEIAKMAGKTLHEYKHALKNLMNDDKQ